MFTQQWDTNSIQVHLDCKVGDTGTFPGTENKVQKFHGLKVLKLYSLFSYYSHTVDYVRNKYEKIFENNPNIFKCNVTFTKRDLQLSH